MNKLDINDPIVEWAIEYPDAIPLFERYGIDYTCGGKSLRYACEQRELDVDEIVKAILNNSPSREEE